LRKEENTMRVLITGAAGFVGTQLVRSLLQRKEILSRPLKELVLADLVRPAADVEKDSRVRPMVGPLIENCPDLAKEQFDVVFHLAGAVSGECEANFELGLRSNLDSCRALLDAVRAAGNRPRFIFASSVAVFGGDSGISLPSVIRDDTLPIPQSSYGIQKFICEQLVADYTRKGFIDGRCGRLMTVAVRSGKPNGAASGFLSAIVREPLNSKDTVCPVPLEMTVALASPSNTINGLIKLAEADSESLGGRTAINFPPLTVKVGEILNALEAIGGRAARARVRFKPDPAIIRIVGSWPSVFECNRARNLGMKPDADMDSIIRQFISEPGAVHVGA
jgi:nucleoside-diphosphate-sugar epimerase